MQCIVFEITLYLPVRLDCFTYSFNKEISNVCVYTNRGFNNLSSEAFWRRHQPKLFTFIWTYCMYTDVSWFFPIFMQHLIIKILHSLSKWVVQNVSIKEGRIETHKIAIYNSSLFSHFHGFLFSYYIIINQTSILPSVQKL